MAETLRHAVVGLGRIGSLLEEDVLREKPCTHAGAVSATAGSCLVAGCDIIEERRARFAERWGCEAVYRDYRQMLAEQPTDVLHIATDPETHYPIVKAAADAGVRVAVCEKPLAHTWRASRAIVRLDRERRITVLVNHERRYSNDYLEARAAVAERRYGEPLAVQARLYFGRTRGLWSMLWHDGTHLLDVAGFVLGAPLERAHRLQGNLRGGGTSAWVAARAAGVPVVLEIGGGRDHLLFELIVSCERGEIHVGNGFYREYESVESPYYEGYRSLQPVRENPFQKTGYFRNMVADAAACAREPERRPVSGAADAEHATRAIFSVRPFLARFG